MGGLGERLGRSEFIDQAYTYTAQTLLDRMDIEDDISLWSLRSRVQTLLDRMDIEDDISLWS